MRMVASATMMLLAGLSSACASAAMPDASSAFLESESEETGWAGTRDAADAAQINDGRLIAERECAACHAIDSRSKSPNRAAPPLRDVLAVNDPDNVAYRFIDALQVGHDEMPLFDFDVRAADALIAYLESMRK